MPLFKFFRRSADRPAEAPPPTPASAPAPTPVAPPATPPPPPPTVQEDVPDSIDHAIELFREIQEVLGDGADIIRLPSRVLLSGLPEDLRGPLWKPDAFPDTPIELERQ